MTEKEQLRKEIVQLIEKIPDFFYTRGASEEQILQAEKELGVSFPESYKWFLRKYGTTLSIYGIGLDGITSLVKYTQNYREQGLPKSFVVIKDVDEWVYCLDTGSMENGECPVKDWDIRGESYRSFPSFYHFFKEELEDEIENL